MITFLHNFNNILGFIWFVGGLLLLPFNSAIIGILVFGIWRKMEYNEWVHICRPIWALQMVWNLIFFSIGFSFHHIQESEETNKISYTLTEEILPENYSHDPDFTKKWNWHFYRNTDKGQVEIDDHSKDATPFQKAFYADDFDARHGDGLDPQGLHVNAHWEYGIFWLGKWIPDEGGSEALQDKFHELPFDEAIAYINRLNTTHNFGEDILYSLLLSVICPFFPMLLEVFGPPLLVTCLFILGKNKFVSMIKSIRK